MDGQRRHPELHHSQKSKERPRSWGALEDLAWTTRAMTVRKVSWELLTKQAQVDVSISLNGQIAGLNGKQGLLGSFHAIGK